MPKIPIKALRLNQMARQSGVSVPSSGHVVERVKFLKGTQLESEIGFLKYCDETYPPLLAKYVVGISQLYRSALGGRASEERLVYDSDGNIAGTVSIGLKNFVPMQSMGDSDHSKPEKILVANPSPSTLVEYNVAEILVSSWRHKEDDMHPGNLGVNGRLDYDMSWYHLLSIIKEPRLVCGITQSMPSFGTVLREEDLHNFPNLESTRTHWPAQNPKNYNRYKIFKAQASFQSLAESKAFKLQVFKALLKELLSFQPKVLKERLSTQLGNTDINLDSLVEEQDSPTINQKTKLLAQAGPELFYRDPESEEEYTFVEHFFKVAQKEYESFYKLVAHYSDFRKYLIDNPSVYLEIREFFENDNKNYSGAQVYDLELMDRMYEKIWRDAAIKPVIKALKRTSDEYHKINNELDVDSFLDVTYSPSFKGPVEDSISSDSLGSGPIQVLADKTINPEDHEGDNDTAQKQIRNIIARLYSNLHNLSRIYFEEQNSIQKNNTDYIIGCKHFLEEARTAVDEIIKGTQTKSRKVRRHAGFEKIYQQWTTVLFEIDYTAHLENRELQKDEPKIKYHVESVEPTQNPSAKILSSDINEVLKDAFVDWLSRQKLRDTIVLANIALDEYSPKVTTGFLSTFNIWSYSRRRAEPTRKLIEKAKRQKDFSSIELVLQIIDEKGTGWNEGSLNTILMTVLLNKMLRDMTSSFTHSSAYPALERFKDAKGRSDFNFYKHILKVKDALLTSLATADVADGSHLVI